MSSSVIYFQTPANQAEKDFADDPEFLEKFKEEWDNKIDMLIHIRMMIRANNFYNPKREPHYVPIADRKVVWSGMPRHIISNHLNTSVPYSKYLAYKEVDKPVRTNNERYQDEYLEWYVHKSPQNKIYRVDFTCEAPEYYEWLWEQDPKKVLMLYQKYISPEVKLDDLGSVNNYNKRNKWNSKLGAMHLQCGPNTLGDEIGLGIESSILYSKNNKIIEDSGVLIANANYGVQTRNSDPHIGAQVNLLVRNKFKVTLKNPVALYLNSFDGTILRKPDGSALTSVELNQLVQFTRGDIATNQGLRCTIECPKDWSFVLGEMTISGQPILYGGQLAEHMLIQLTGQAAMSDKLQFEKSASEFASITIESEEPRERKYTCRAPVGDQ